ncbi:MAG: hypothetical protein HY744_31715 [Deltaproteobacteria bacterium]|nr:hypothetical protein [Deltaproteobacteria bacterium]
MLRRALLAVLLCALGGCRAGADRATPAVPMSSAPDAAVPTARPPVATDGHLEIRLELDTEVAMDRVPMRAAKLHFRNVGRDPLRFYLPRSEPFRANISTLSFTPEGNARPLVVPEPRPHGYEVTEADFHLLAPGEERVFAQPFTLDQFVPGPGQGTERRAGFEPGTVVRVRWVYENEIRRWEGRRLTLDGPTRELFGGGDIPWIWTGKLAAELAWKVPP